MAAALLLGGCAAFRPAAPPSLRGAAAVELEAVPFFPQRDYQCGPAALATVLAHSGVPVNPAALVEEVYLPARKGSLQAELIAAARRHGRLPYRIAPELATLAAELRAGRPVLVLQNLGLERWPTWHYAVVVGHEAGGRRFILRSGEEARRIEDARRFAARWQRAGAWGLVLLRPGEMPARLEPERYLRAAAALEATGGAEAAAAAYRAALRRWPANRVAGIGLGNALYAAGRLPEAEVAYRAVLERAPGDAAALNNLAQVLADRGCPEAALAAVDAARAALPPGSPLQATVDDTARAVAAVGRRSCTPAAPAPL